MIDCAIETFAKSSKATVVEIGPLEVYFSYNTPIAFRDSEGKLIVRANEWGPTTGKHMVALGVDRGDRIPGDEFERRLHTHLLNVFRSRGERQ